MRALSCTPNGFRPRRLASRVLVAVVVLAMSEARAGEEDATSLPGYVDGSAFAELAGEDSQIVEVSIRAPLLRALSRAASDEAEGAGDLLRQLQSISAFIVGLDKDANRTERAARMVREMEARLERRGWERLARVREKSSNVGVFIRNDDKIIDGLVVLALDRDGSQVVFANIAGVIDLARLKELSNTLNVPGLEEIGDADDTSPQPRRARKKDGRSKKARESKKDEEAEEEEEEEEEP